MTEPQQKDFEELLEQLKQEEETCESCSAQKRTSGQLRRMRHTWEHTRS